MLFSQYARESNNSPKGLKILFSNTGHRASQLHRVKYMMLNEFPSENKMHVNIVMMVDATTYITFMLFYL